MGRGAWKGAEGEVRVGFMAGQGDSSPGAGREGPVPGAGWEVPHVPRPPEAPRHTPPGAFSAPAHAPAAPAPPADGRARPPRRRAGPARKLADCAGPARKLAGRAPDLAAVAGVVAALPLMVLSFFVVLLALFAVDAPMDALDIPGEAVVLGWFASGLVVFLPAAEPFLARRLLGLRRPTDAEAVLVQAAWADAAGAAGVDPRSYALWMDDRPGINACVPGGRFLAVPRSAVELPPRQRAAVLAHELAHHLRGHATARLLVQWYSAPARGMLRAIAALLRTGGRGNAVLAPLGCVFGVVLLLLAGVGVWAVVEMPRLRLALLVLPFLPLAGRWAEKQCDRLAADAGYGPDLLAVLARWQESGRALGADGGGALASRPGAATRADALRRYLASR